MHALELLLTFASNNGLSPAGTLRAQLLFAFAPETRVQLLEHSAAADPHAAYLLGLLALRGRKGHESDPVPARQWYRQAAERGHADAMFELGLLFLWGRGGPEDELEARHWELRAAEAGHARACLNMGARAASQWRGEPDLEAARRWYAQAADGGSAEAAARLCLMLANGDVETHEPGDAQYWFCVAKELGYEWSSAS